MTLTTKQPRATTPLLNVCCPGWCIQDEYLFPPKLQLWWRASLQKIEELKIWLQKWKRGPDRSELCFFFFLSFPMARSSDCIEPYASFRKNVISTFIQNSKCHFKYSISNIFASVPWILTRDLIKLSRLALDDTMSHRGRAGYHSRCGDNSLFLYHFQHTRPCIIHLKLLETLRRKAGRRLSATDSQERGKSNCTLRCFGIKMLKKKKKKGRKKTLGPWRKGVYTFETWDGRACRESQALLCAVMIPVLHILANEQGRNFQRE